MTDGILLPKARATPILGLRHDHHRRGPRAQPQHRLPARLPEAAAAPAAGPEAHHHLGDHRRRALRRHFGGAPVIEVSGRLYPVEVRYRPVADNRKRTTSAISTTPSSMPSTNWPAWPRRHPGLPARRAGIREGRRGAGRKRHPAHAEILPLFSACRPSEQDRIFKPGGGGASCWRPTSPKPRSPCRASATWSIPAGAGQAPIPTATRSNSCRSRRCPRRRPGSGPGVAARWRRACASACYDEADFNARAVHRSGNPALQPGRRHPAHEVAEADRRREFPFIVAAAAQASRRLCAVAGTGALDDANALTRSARPWPNCRWTRASAACWWPPGISAASGKCWSSPPPVGAGPAGAAPGRQQAPTRNTGNSPTKNRVPRLVEALAMVPAAVEHKKSRKSAGRHRPRPFPVVPAPARVARGAPSQLRHGHRAGLEGKPDSRHPDAIHRPCSPGCSAISAASPTNPAITWARAASATSSIPLRRSPRRPASGSWRPRSPRPPPVRPLRRPHRGRTGSRKWALT